MMDFEADDGTEFEGANLVQASGNAAPPPVARSGGMQVLTANAQGVVVLPAGVAIDHIEVEGRDLVIVAVDGTRYIVVDGTIVVPQIVIGDVAVPPVTLAALLEGLDIAALNPQSSGNNFAGPVGEIQAAYALGNLLPYTELQFPGEPEREVIPDVVNRDPGTVIITPNNPAGAVMATASVNEAGLPARGAEPAGSNAASNSETTTGTIIYTAPDGLQSISLNGTVIANTGQTFAGSFGTLTITSIAPGAIGYTYTLADNTLTGANEVFAVTVREVDGDVANASLTITIVDDAPTARNDTDSVPASTFTGESGNVLTGTGTTSGAAGADTPGADGITLTGVFAGTAGSTFAAPGTINGLYGTLAINAAGNYTYTRSHNTPGGVNDVFTYRITDGDGDTSTATLTISIGDAPAMVTSVPTTGGGTVVDEEGLPPRGSEPSGSNPGSPVESTTGTITFVAPDGVATVAINGTPVTGPGQQITTPQGVMTIDTFNPSAGTLTYTFTLTDNTSGDSTQVSLSITVTDIDGDSDTKPFVITIIDDEPTARHDH
jgi:VCBS repeat-containing protein